MSLSASLVFVLSLLMALLGSCDRTATEAEIRIDPVVIEAKKLCLDHLRLDSEIVGNLKYRGGVRLTSPDPRFGGLSALSISPDGRTFVVRSDEGHRFQGELVYDERDNLAGIADAEIETIRDSKENKPPRSMVPPEDLKARLSSGDIRAVTPIPDNRLFVLTEAVGSGGGVSGWVGGDGGWSKLSYTTCARETLKMRHKVQVSPCFKKQKQAGSGYFEEFRPVAATTTPGGEIIIVEKGIPYIATRLRLLRATDIRPMARLEAEELAILEDSLAFHNIQGVHTRQASGGETLIYLVSNDHYTGPQATVLLMFELVG